MSKKFVLDAFVKPFFAILFFLGFGGPFVFFGFQTTHVAGKRSGTNTASFNIHRTHFWGLVNLKGRVDHVTEAEVRTDSSGTGTRRTTTSNVFLISGNKATSVFTGSSSVNNEDKRDLVRGVNAFIKDEEQDRFEETVNWHNVFGWVGLPFLAIGVIGLLGWPWTIVRKWQERGKTPPEEGEG
jgi:hypothetical protein